MAMNLLNKDDSVLILIDLQEKLWNTMFNKDEVEKNALILLELAKRTGIPVLVTEQYKKGLGGTNPSIAHHVAESDLIDKVCFSCFDADLFINRLFALRRETLIIAGIEAHICVLQTALSALKHDYSVHLVADATGSRTESNYRAGIERMRDSGCTVTTTEMAVFEVIREAGTPLFKEMLPLIK